MKAVSTAAPGLRLFGSATATWLCLAAVLTLLIGGRDIGSALGLKLSGQWAVVASVILATALLVRGGSRWSALGLRKPARWWMLPLSAIAIYLACVIAIVLVSRPLKAALHWPPTFVEALEPVQGHPEHLALLLALIWTTVAFGEELLFRGLLLNGIAGALGGTRAAFAFAACAQAVVFGLAHYTLGPSGMLDAGLIGLVFGVVYLRNGRQLPALILAHGMIDTISVLALYAGVKPG
jgi:uncharacterized protein